MVCSYSSFLSKSLQNPGRYKANKLPLLLLLSCSQPVRAHSISDARAKERERERLAGLGCKLSVGLGFLCPVHTAIMTHCGCFSNGFWREAWDTKCTGAVETGLVLRGYFAALFRGFSCAIVPRSHCVVTHWRLHLPSATHSRETWDHEQYELWKQVHCFADIWPLFFPFQLKVQMRKLEKT
jgi:hypothetical protein